MSQSEAKRKGKEDEGGNREIGQEMEVESTECRGTDHTSSVLAKAALQAVTTTNQVIITLRAGRSGHPTQSEPFLDATDTRKKF